MVEQEVSRSLSRAHRLDRFLTTYPQRPFSWTDHHCAVFAAAWERELTGKDSLGGWGRIEGGNARRAYREVRRKAGDLSTLVSRQLEQPAKSAAFARLGDVVLLPTGQTRGALGICAGRKSAFLSPEGGIIYHPTSDATLCWHL